MRLFGRKKRKPDDSSGSRSDVNRRHRRYVDDEGIGEMLAELEQATDPLDRHFLYERIVRETFRRRKDDHKLRDLCEQIGLQHLQEFPRIAPLLKSEIGYGRMPHVLTFQCVATLMTEWGAYKKAIDIYEMGLAYGIDDASDGGFQAKIIGLHQLMR